MLRLILYILAGVVSVLLGWNITQVILGFLQWLSNNFDLVFVGLLREWPEMIIFPLITIFLASGMVLNEIFISTPTRSLRNLKIAYRPLIISIIIGLFVGLLIGGLLQIFYLPRFDFSDRTVRVVSWWSIGVTVGFIEGITWQFHSMEAGDKKRSQKRLVFSLFFASLSSIIAAGIFEWIRGSVVTTSAIFQQIEDPLGFCILGMLLGIAFTITTSPSYLAALRAGKGFEFRVDDRSPTTQSIDTTYVQQQQQNNSKSFPVISNKAIQSLKFVSETSAKKIEEGLSIELPEVHLTLLTKIRRSKIIESILNQLNLPSNNKKTPSFSENIAIRIGGTPKKEMPNGQIIGSDIYLPNTPPHLADIIVNKRETKLIPNPQNYEKIEINFIPLDSTEEVTLKHNTLLAFYTTNEPDENNPNQPKMYRFVYYNRFLDPES